jgi:uncharacterized OB-fold protein
MKPATYWRQNKTWSTWLGKTGTVVASTRVRVAAPNRTQLLPYSYVLVSFEDEKREFMAAGHEKLSVGDEVTCVLRKMSVPDEKGIIEYGIKVKRIT